MARNDILNITDLDGFDRGAIDVPIDFRINDFRSLSSRQGSNSKTIKIPGTKKNDSILSWRFMLDAEGFFDDNAQTPVVVERDNIRIIQGSLQLYKTTTNDGKIVEYETVIYSNNAEWFTAIGNASIRSLDLGSHVYDEATIRASWLNNGDSVDPFVYGLADYGFFTGKTDISNIVVERLRPAFFVLPIFKAILNNAGFSLSSDFFKRKEFRDLVILFTNEQLIIKLLGTMLASFDTGQVFITGQNRVIEYQNDSTGFNNDPDNAYNPLTGQWICPQDGSYRIATGLLFRATFPPTGDITVTIRVNGTPIRTESYIKYNFQEPGEMTEIGITPGRNAAALVAGDVVTVAALTNLQDSTVTKGSYLQIDPLSDVFPGHTLQNAEQLPDIKQKDLVKWLFTQFNLVATSDNNRGLVEIETRNKFYTTIDDAEDWTELVDYSQQIEFTKITEGLKRTLNFDYKEDDGDDNLVSFRDSNKQGIGDTSDLLENEFLKGTQNITNEIFAATFMGETFTDTIYMPLLINDVELDNIVDGGGVREYTKFEPRICYYNGLQAGAWTFETTAETQYPQLIFYKQVSEFKDISLAFGNIRDVEPSIQSRDTGLRDRYYHDLINNINFGRLITLSLQLDATHIQALDFKKLKFLTLNGERKYFILNKIENYLAGSPDSTVVELLEWKPSNSVNQV